MKKVVVVHPRRAPPVFVCRKCLKRSEDAKHITHALKRETKRSAGDRDRPARVIKTSCFGICPKRAVVVTGGVAASKGDYALITSGTDVPAALDRLQRDGRGG